MEAVPGMRLRHLASWAGAAGPGAASSPGEQAGRVRGRWQWQLAGLAMHRMWRMPSACPGTSPSGSKCLVGGQEQAASPGPPPHTCYPEQESGPGMDRQQGPRLHLHFATGYHLPYLGLREKGPKVPTSQGFREAFGKRTKGPAGWEPEGNLDTSAWVLSGRRGSEPPGQALDKF